MTTVASQRPRHITQLPFLLCGEYIDVLLSQQYRFVFLKFNIALRVIAHAIKYSTASFLNVIFMEVKHTNTEKYAD